jgi:phosphoglucomutase
MQKMADMMDELRTNPPKELNGSPICWVGDYKTGITTDGETGLPKSNVLSYRMESGDTFIVRPSGTEPKIKIYITAKASSREEAEKKLTTVSLSVKELLGIE